MKKQLFIIAVLVIGLAAFGCKGDKDPHKGHDHSGHDHSGHDHSKHAKQMVKTKVVIVDGVQAAFDLMTKVEHADMMKKMGVAEKKADASDHFILITLMEKPENVLIKDASVEISVTGPDNKAIKTSTHVMSGDGMHHFAAGVSMKAKGEYKVEAAVSVKKKKVAVKTSFTVI
ncbi:MAG: hypothetical protein GY754_46300 [bacterium]|nr:hypothetical protein [bacterium]